MIDPVEFLTAIVEASIGLLGFTGVVVALDRSSDSSWSSRERVRIVNLLGWGSITLGSTLLSLALLSAELQPQLLWRVASLIWLAFAVPFSTWQIVGIFRIRPLKPFTWVYVISTYTFLIGVAAFQLGNVVQWNVFWPHFSALTVGLGLGASQFVRLLWFKLF